jgi:DNA-binding CsgD family transcriptional regulator
MRSVLTTDRRSGSALAPAVEKCLLGLHATTDLDSFWRAVQQLIDVAVPNHVVGLTLQHSPILPLNSRWTQPMAPGFFATQPLKKFIAGQQHKKFLRIANLFSSSKSFRKSVFYRRYMAPQNCVDAVCLLFWERQRLIYAIVIMRTAAQGNLSPAGMKLLRQLYPQFLTVLRRLRSLELERAVRKDLEEFVRRLPLPTMLLRWNLKLLFQNPAARDFCAVWEKGWENARLMKAASPVPSEILDQCRRIKQAWTRMQRPKARQINLKPAQVYHPHRADLRATIYLKRLHSVVARPHFLIECEDLRRHVDAPSGRLGLERLIRLSGRQQEIAQLVCDGRSNQEIADTACLSLPTVKKHLYAVFRKLEVSSRAQLMALLL